MFCRPLVAILSHHIENGGWRVPNNGFLCCDDTEKHALSKEPNESRRKRRRWKTTRHPRKVELFRSGNAHTDYDDDDDGYGYITKRYYRRINRKKENITNEQN